MLVYYSRETRLARCKMTRVLENNVRKSQPGVSMLTKEENERLTRVGPGTPAGELLRRYWLPVGVASELSAETPTQIVRILGETLVLFRDKSGRAGLLEEIGRAHV